MSKFELLVSSIICGIAITFVLTWTATSIDNKNLSRVLLWQAVIPVYLAGPGPILLAIINKQTPSMKALQFTC